MSRDPAHGGDGELIAAYVDGVAELSVDERRRAEAALADAPGRAEAEAMRGLLDELRALPPEGNEPNWSALEQSIREAVGQTVPRPWWRRWRWLAPALTCATAAAAWLIIASRPDVIATPIAPPLATRTPAAATHQAVEPDDEAVQPLWLDGAEIDVDPSAADLVGDTSALLGEDDLAPGHDDEGDTGERLLPDGNYTWVDDLDDAALERAEHWLSGDKPGANPGDKAHKG